MPPVSSKLTVPNRGSNGAAGSPVNAGTVAQAVPAAPGLQNPFTPLRSTRSRMMWFPLSATSKELFLPVACWIPKLHFWNWAILVVLLALNRLGGAKFGTFAWICASVWLFLKPLINPTLLAAAWANMLPPFRVSPGAMLLPCTKNELTPGALEAKLSVNTAGKASLKSPIPPRTTVLCEPNGDHAKPKRGCQRIELRPCSSWCSPCNTSVLYGVFTLLSAIRNGWFRRLKQLVWQTGLDSCSTRRAKVSVRFGFIFQSSSP